MENCFGGASDFSLEQAIRHKYCPPVDYGANAIEDITQTALEYKPGVLLFAMFDVSKA